MADPRLYGWQGIGPTSQPTEEGVFDRPGYSGDTGGFYNYLFDQGYQVDPATGQLRLKNMAQAQNEYDTPPEWISGGAHNLRLENGNRGFFEDGTLKDSGERWTDQQDQSGFGGFMNRFGVPLLIVAAGGLIASQGGFAAASNALGGGGGAATGGSGLGGALGASVPAELGGTAAQMASATQLGGGAAAAGAGMGGMTAAEIAGLDLSSVAGSVPEYAISGGSAYTPTAVASGGLFSGTTVPGLVSGVSNLASAMFTDKTNKQALEKSDPFASQRGRYFEPTATASQSLAEAQALATKGLNDPTFWDQGWLNDAAERSGREVQAKLAAQGYNMSGNTPLEMSKNMRDTRAGYIIPGQQNLISNVSAASGALGAQGSLAGAQFNPASATGSFMQGQSSIPGMINQGLGSIFYDPKQKGTTQSLNNLWEKPSNPWSNI